MFNTIVRKSQKIVGTVKNRLAPAAAELKLRQQFAFEILHPQVELVKRSPSMQIAVGAAISSLILSGNLASAAGLAGAWFCSKPLIHAVAGGVGAVGMVDAGLLAAIQRLRTIQAQPSQTSIAS